ncbi:MAG: MFS transporter [Spirochaetes bacterium RBG_13_51_14]|nr:MAG: MFS transporter [Spirochaetes bacterium RBG_13_51_14]
MIRKLSAAVREFSRNSAIIFVVLFGFVSLFADMTYEGARSIMGPYLKLLGGSAAVVGFVAGFGELVGYAFRIVTGYLADRTKRYWLLTFMGYAINLLAVPFLALTGNWISASILLVVERFGKSIRTPARDAMLSYARSRVGSGWTYGLHEAMDQVGAVLGPVIVAGVLYFRNGDYRLAFAVLLLPALVSLTLVLVGRILYPRPSELEVNQLEVDAKGLGRGYWLYLAAVGCIALGFADFPLLAYHFQTKGMFSESMIPILYAAAMAVDALSALFFGWLYDRVGVKSLIIAALASCAFAPLAFLGGAPAAWAGVIVWGIGMGWQESIMRSVISDMAPRDRRASAFGIFNAGYGVFWFAGSWALGSLYDLSLAGGFSLAALSAISVAVQIVAVPIYIYLTMSGRRADRIQT